jgi:hypothetical protein
MELDEIRLRVNMLKESKEKDQEGVKDIELLLLWDFVKSIAESGIKGQKRIAEYLLSSGIKSVHQIDLIDDHLWKRPFTSFAEFKGALQIDDAHQT